MSKDRALLCLMRKDQETGLHYNCYRYYSPFVGRFVSKDQIGLWGGINVYQYISSSISWVDPLGLQKSGKQKQGSAKAEEGTPKKTCPHSNVVNALENFQTKNVSVWKQYIYFRQSCNDSYFKTTSSKILGWLN